jgi:hypothetical protein
VGSVPTFTVGVLPIFTVLPEARVTVPATFVVPCAVIGTGLLLVFATVNIGGLFAMTLRGCGRNNDNTPNPPTTLAIVAAILAHSGVPHGRSHSPTRRCCWQWMANYFCVIFV